MSATNFARDRQRQRWYAWLRWGDWLTAGLVGSLAVVLLLIAPGRLQSATAAAVLLQDGQVVLTIPADDLIAGGELSFDANGYHYHFVYEAGRIRFADADCPDRVCVHTGWISRSGQIAACVPGRLILKIIGGTETIGTDDVDVIVR